MVRLYGRGAITIQADKKVYTAQNGVLDVPEHLVRIGIANGYSRERPAVVESEPPMPLPEASTAADEDEGEEAAIAADDEDEGQW